MPSQTQCFVEEQIKVKFSLFVVGKVSLVSKWEGGGARAGLRELSAFSLGFVFCVLCTSSQARVIASSILFLKIVCESICGVFICNCKGS
jgi:hypothetical protein